MNDAVKRENNLALQNLLGLTPEQAAKTLEASVLITNASDAISVAIATYTYDLLARTLKEVNDHLLPDMSPDLEIVIGNAKPLTAHAIFAQANKDSFLISKTQPESGSLNAILPEPFALLGACYLSGFAIRILLPEIANIPARDSLLIDFRSLFGEDQGYLTREVDIGTTYLAGAGAVGNGFMLGLTCFPNLVGKLIVVDDDEVSEGNLNRCLWFEARDVNDKKAKALVAKAQDRFKNLALENRISMLGEVPEKTDGAWLERLVVAVDSRRARRSLQSEAPGEVFDASTTGLEEIVFHHHKQPTTTACLGCIYYADEAEDQHTQHVAEALGVSIEDVAKTHIDPSAAMKIKAKYPDLTSRNLEGIPFDTFFKELCGAGKLAIDGGEQVIAPLSFVSVMAGVYLAIEFVRRTATGQSEYNYWRLHPWAEPSLRTRRVLPRQDECEFCSDENFRSLVEKLWRKP